ncbi:MAG TPA: DUF2079 domain-containing protein [Ktedonosporobacter sp.]|jgi:uncharacterized membrane protein|nr:DUF2079 domain-containing protein [Ktedonosporobacter sp.]
MKISALRLRFTRQTQERIAWLLLALLILIYALVISYLAVLRYDTFKATAFDLGNMDQVLWNTIHGRPFQFTNQGADWFGPPTRLAIHFEPIIFPLSLLYIFGADPRILLVFQTLALVSGSLPVFLLTRKYLPAWPLLSPMMALVYLLMPALLSLNIFDFHPVSLATPLLLYAVLALTYGRYVWFLIACVLAASCKEDIPLSIAMFGILVIWMYKLPRLGTVLIVGGLIWSLLAFLVIIPHFYPGAQHNNYWYRYEALGSSPGAAIINLLLHPWLLFTTFITLDRLYYLANLLRGGGFLALLAPEWLLPALPSLAVNLLSTDPLLYSGVFHYNAAIIPFILLAVIHGTSRFVSLWQQWRGEAKEHASWRSSIEQFTTMGPSWASKGMPVWLASLGSNFALLRSNVVQSVAVHPAFTRSTAFIQPRLTRLAHTGNYQWQRFSERLTPLAITTSAARLQWFIYGWLIVMMALNFVIMSPALNAFWPDHLPGTREQHIQQLLSMIPPNASVSAGSNLNPHLSERLYVTVFPAITFSSSEKSINNTVQYVIVDLQAVFPEDQVGTANELNQLINSKQFRVLARAEGVILLVRRRL